MDTDIQQIQSQVEQEAAFVQRLQNQIRQVIVGQQYLVERLLMGILADGHILIEGVPGLAKTLSVNTLAQSIQAKFQRIQFTPDLLPADLIGTMIYNPQTSEFTVKKGPVFANIILADEINRAPAKVQSALLEAMQERQVTIGETTFPLEQPFLVLATQNPIEQEGTYPLPEAQVDRFMMMLKITHPTPAEEREIMERNTGAAIPKIQPVITPADIIKAREVVRSVYIDDKVKEYIVNLVFASREPEKYGLTGIKNMIAFGASPRATIYLNLAAKTHAFVRGRGYVTPEDIKAIGHDILRHRILITYEAEAEDVTSDDIVTRIFDAVEVP
ncbi:AAA domain-containing protein [candidate division GN15 bacterium]|nr:AAA domain-containing protein [candidate division GN15 bacterium]